ncbi:MAG: lytic murein transglycosylase [Pseudomonadales bacterium]|jgi:membrane-bound lytic murein transglycosylase B|nr:lytic murein transglycosylase [Pseudomonadales bacterium]
MRIRNSISLYFSGLVVAVLWAVLQPAHADTGFRAWIQNFRGEAISQGVTGSVYDDAFRGVTEPDLLVLEKANYQPEFKAEVWEYLDSRVQERAITNGQVMLQQYAKELASIEKSSGVDRHVLLAIWSMESNYGAVLQDKTKLHYIPRALATLAYADPKRAKFARTQLIAALKILQRGDVEQAELLGSWAGAMGHTQFIPTSYIAYAVDFDGDGKSDIWHSVPDALATAAQLLKKNGWRSGESWGYEILPSNKGSGEELLALQADKGPVFALQKNFFVVKRYNNADKYALAVLLLSDRIAGKPAPIKDWTRPYTPLDMTEKEELQRLLAAHGFYSGVVDGVIGGESREAIKRFQASKNVEQTGYASKEVLQQLRGKN